MTDDGTFFKYDGAAWPPPAGDTRRRLPCIYCGEPCVSDTPEDPMSWAHAPEAGDDADHTADIFIIPLKPAPEPADN